VCLCVSVCVYVSVCLSVCVVPLATAVAEDRKVSVFRGRVRNSLLIFDNAAIFTVSRGSNHQSFTESGYCLCSFVWTLVYVM